MDVMNVMDVMDVIPQRLESSYRHFMRVRKIAKNDYWLRHVCLSVRPSLCLFVCSPYEITRLPLDEFS